MFLSSLPRFAWVSPVSHWTPVCLLSSPLQWLPMKQTPHSLSLLRRWACSPAPLFAAVALLLGTGAVMVCRTRTSQSFSSALLLTRAVLLCVLLWSNGCTFSFQGFWCVDVLLFCYALFALLGLAVKGVAKNCGWLHLCVASFPFVLHSSSLLVSANKRHNVSLNSILHTSIFNHCS